MEAVAVRSGILEPGRVAYPATTAFDWNARYAKPGPAKLLAPGRILPDLPRPLDRRFEAVIFDWDGTAVASRGDDATQVRQLAEALSAAAVDVVVVSGTHLGNIDAQFGARPPGPGRLHLCLNRGSEVYAVDSAGVRLLKRRQATEREDRRLTRAADLTVVALRRRGLRAQIVAERLNRRKIDLIPLPEWADPPKALIGELLMAVEQRIRGAGIASLAAVVEIAQRAAKEAGLPDAKVTSDAKHIEIGLTDKADSARWAFDDLWARGTSPGLVLVAGDEFGSLGGLSGSDSLMLVPEGSRATAVSVGVEPEGVPGGVIHLPGGPAAFWRILHDQLCRRADGDLPEIDVEPRWSFEVPDLDRERERVHEALLTLANGRFGGAGAPMDDHPITAPRVHVNGTYLGAGPATTLAPCPLWDRTGLALDEADELRRVLDLRTGVLAEERTHGDARRRAVRFVSLARPAIAAVRVDADDPLVPVGPVLVAPSDMPAETRRADGRERMATMADGDSVVAVAREIRHPRRGGVRLDRMAAYAAGPRSSIVDPLPALGDAEAAGFDRLLAGQRSAWAERWAAADIRIEGDDELDRAVRFALFHLMSSVADAGEAAVGARGLSGPAYRGHVFWDSDVFVLPFLAATHPAAAKAMLEYRLRRLPAAERAATDQGRSGARFPWESAATGDDVTPTAYHDQTGRQGVILTGALEEHITADVAWAVDAYCRWTGDSDFLTAGGRRLLRETGAYWASRIELGADGRGHIRRVIGPDEYHEAVDDNAFTNVLVQWNLRRAAEELGPRDPERKRWRSLAAGLVDGYDPSTGLYEQFSGYFDLEPLVIRDIAPRRPIAADLLLGRERIQGSQVVKQADVLMLHHLVPEVTYPGSLLANLEFYEPRTAHGSSLSPGIHAGLLARVGRLDEALALLGTVTRLDLDDITGTTSGGLHLAAMGSVWQALVHGFAGIRAGRHSLEIDPRLPDSWTALEVPVTYRGTRVRFRIEPGSVVVDADGPLRLRIAGSRARQLASGRTRFIARGMQMVEVAA